MRIFLLVLSTVSIISWIYTISTKFESFSVEKKIKSILHVFIFVFIGLSFTKNEMKYVRVAYTFFLIKESSSFVFMNIKDDVVTFEKIVLNSLDFMVHVIMLILCIQFAVIYTDRSCKI